MPNASVCEWMKSSERITPLRSGRESAHEWIGSLTICLPTKTKSRDSDYGEDLTAKHDPFLCHLNFGNDSVSSRVQ